MCHMLYVTCYMLYVTCYVYTYVHIHIHTFESQVMKKVPPRNTGLRRLRRFVYTNPHEYTITKTGSRASDEDARNTHAPTKPRKASTYMQIEEHSAIQKLKGKNTSNEKQNVWPAVHEPGISTVMTKIA